MKKIINKAHEFWKYNLNSITGKKAVKKTREVDHSVAADIRKGDTHDVFKPKGFR